MQYFANKSLRYKMLLSMFGVILPIIFLVQFFILPTFKEKIMEEKKQKTQNAVDLVTKLFESYEQRFKDGKLTREQAQFEAKEEVRKCQVKLPKKLQIY